MWANHIRVLQLPPALKLYEIVAGSLYDLGALFLATLLIWLPITLWVGVVDCYSDRMRTAEAAILGNSVKEPIEANAARLGTLEGSGLGVEFAPRGKFTNGGYVSRNGTIVVTTGDPIAILIFQPRMEKGSVTWSCSGYPSKVLPAACRQLPVFP
jgi:hypothetical protein